MNKKQSQSNAEAKSPEINNTGSNSFEGVPDDVVFVIFPFLRLQDMGNLASVNREFRRIITNAFTNPNMYTAYPGMFEALCKFWHENPVAFNNLRGAILTGAILSGAKFSKTKLTGAKLTNANLWRVNLTGADLSGATLRVANLTGAKLTNACLAYTTLKEANWSGADLRGANLRGAILTGAILSGAKFSKTKLTGAKLTNANLWRVNLTGANLTGVNLKGADLNDANLFECAFSPNTKLEGIKIDSTSLLRVFIDGRNPQNATTNIWSLNNKMLGAFKLLLPHADIKELEILMKGVNERISVHFLDFIFGALEKAKLLKLISDEIAKKQASQKMECEKPTQKESISGNSQQQNSSAINSTLESPNQNANTTTLNTELGENENHETDLNLTPPNQSP